MIKEFGYITVVKIKKEGNKFDNNIYKLNTNPKKTVVENLHNGEENIELSTENIQKKEKNVDNPVDNSRSVDSPSWKNSMTQISTTRNYTTNINNNNINSFNNNNINCDELSDEEKEYLLNWIDYMMKE